jgi:hypothetical protein
MAQGKFTATIDGWARKSEDRMRAVRNDAAQTAAEEVTTPVDLGGHMRVDTGFLKASLVASTTAMPAIDPNARPPADAAPGSIPIDLNAVALVIAGATLEDTIYLGFTASYARPREYHDGFVRLTAQRWPQIVKESNAKIRGRVEGR